MITNAFSWSLVSCCLVPRFTLIVSTVLVLHGG